MRVTDVSDDDRSAVELIEAGTSLTGALAGAAIGMLGGAEAALGGAAAGATLSTALKHVAGQIRQRVLARGEEARIGATLAFTIVAVSDRLAAGEHIRPDWFADASDNDRTAAEEVGEGVLLAARDEFQQKKLKLYGELLASIAFERDISRAHANYLLRQLEELTYRQICLLTLACRRKLAKPSYNGVSLEDARSAEVDDLMRRNLLRLDEAVAGKPAEHVTAWSNGALLCRLLRLDSIADEELSTVVGISVVRSAVDSAPIRG